MTTPARLQTHADILPGYQFARSVGRYRSNATGRFISRREVLGLLRSQIDAGQAQLAELTTAYYEGRIAPGAWMEQSRTILRRLHLQNSALGAGGFDRLGQREFGRVGRRIRQDYAALERQHARVQAGEESLAQALNIAAGLVGSARTQFWSAERDHRGRSDSSVAIIERNRLAAGAQHCTSCVAEYERGWQPVGVIPLPGFDRECGVHCQCTIDQREVPAREIGEWLGTKR